MIESSMGNTTWTSGTNGTGMTNSKGSIVTFDNIISVVTFQFEDRKSL